MVFSSIDFLFKFYVLSKGMEESVSVCGQSFVLFVWGEGYAMVSRPVFSFHNCELQDEFLDRRQFGAGTEKAKTGGGSDF